MRKKFVRTQLSQPFIQKNKEKMKKERNSKGCYNKVYLFKKKNTGNLDKTQLEWNRHTFFPSTYIYIDQILFEKKFASRR